MVFTANTVQAQIGVGANAAAFGYTLLPNPTGIQSNTTTFVANVDSSGNWTSSWMDTRTYDLIAEMRKRSVLVRHERNHRLSACDWTQGADSPLTAEQKTAWATYRTALRNLPTAPGFPLTHVWPTKPQ
jgi:hypothetical protein